MYTLNLLLIDPLYQPVHRMYLIQQNKDNPFENYCFTFHYFIYLVYFAHASPSGVRRHAK